MKKSRYLQDKGRSRIIWKRISKHRKERHWITLARFERRNPNTIDKKSTFENVNISFLLGFSSFLMSFLLPVDLSPVGCIDPRMCVSPLCHFRRYSFYQWCLDCVFQSVPKLFSVSLSDVSKCVSKWF
jgi:hypothetical protein